MFFIPLSQLESVELVVHALRVAAGEADCTHCPVRKVCMKQCLTIADSVQTMMYNGTLPTMDTEAQPAQHAPFHDDPAPQPDPNKPKKTMRKKGHLQVVK